MEYRAIQRAVLERTNALLARQNRVLVAIDGRCGAGKTTLAAALQAELACPVIPMDAFFLRPEQRTSARLAEPGGNVDRERFYREVLLPLREGNPFSYRPFDCRAGALEEPVWVPSGPVTLVEGSYSCHPLLRGAYDLRVFLSVEKTEQLARIRRRNGEACARRFADTWIPLEERYFAMTKTAECCELQFST